MIKDDNVVTQKPPPNEADSVKASDDLLIHTKWAAGWVILIGPRTYLEYTNPRRKDS